MKKFRILVAAVLCLTTGFCWAGNLEGGYREPGMENFYYVPVLPSNIIDGVCYEIDWMDYTDVEKLNSPTSYIELEYDGVLFPVAAVVMSPMRFKEEGSLYSMIGGCYQGDMVVSGEVYGLDGIDRTFPVIGIYGMYRNGLTSLYLPESIEFILYTIDSCRYLERVHLNNSLRELQGVKNCPVLTDCPLPLSLEKIGDGWMSGIAISETEFPEHLAVIGQGVFCDNPNLEKISLGQLEETGDSCFCRLPALREITLPATLRKLGSGSFSGCDALERVTLPSAPVLSEGSFSGCPMIREVSVYAESPYAFPSDCMTGTDKSGCTLNVPKGCEEAYATAPGWREFGKIVGSLSSGESIVDSGKGEWRAFASRGLLIVDNAADSPLAVYSASGQQVATVTEKGRNEITLPRGVYLVSSRGKTLKVSI